VCLVQFLVHRKKSPLVCAAATMPPSLQATARGRADCVLFSVATSLPLQHTQWSPPTPPSHRTLPIPRTSPHSGLRAFVASARRLLPLLSTLTVAQHGDALPANLGVLSRKYEPLHHCTTKNTCNPLVLSIPPPVGLLFLWIWNFALFVRCLTRLGAGTA
jgi:hypothetical protein